MALGEGRPLRFLWSSTALQWLVGLLWLKGPNRRKTIKDASNPKIRTHLNHQILLWQIIDHSWIRVVQVHLEKRSRLSKSLTLQIFTSSGSYHLKIPSKLNWLQGLEDSLGKVENQMNIRNKGLMILLMEEILDQLIWEIIPVFTRFYTSHMVQDFFNQPYGFRKKCLIRPQLGKPMVGKLFIRPYFFGWPVRRVQVE